MTRRPALLVPVLLALLGTTAPAQLATADPTPLGPETRASVETGFTQKWAKVVMDASGSRFVVAWTWVVGQDLYMRSFDGQGSALTGDVQVNTTLTSGTQDEPMVAMDAAGNVIVCWSDRAGYDGWQMGCFGRVFGRNGAALGPEFQINQSGALASQWEPMPSALPGGGWVVAFNGDNDGNAYLRYLNTNGTPFTGDVDINTYTNNGQTEAECAVLPDGTVFAVYADFGANVFPFTGTNLFGRRFDAAGNALEVQEFPVHESTVDFDQLEPRIAASNDTFVMVWEDRGNDGSGAGIYARRYDAAGNALEAEWPVNAVTVGDQRLPEVAADAAGNFIVCWEDESSGSGAIVARAFRADGTPLGIEFPVSQATASDYLRPQVTLSASGEAVVFSYGGIVNDEDVFIRRFAWPHETAPPLSGRALRGPGTPGAPKTPIKPPVSPSL